MNPWHGAFALVCVAVVLIGGGAWLLQTVRDARAWRRHMRIRGTPDLGFVPSLMKRQAP